MILKGHEMGSKRPILDRFYFFFLNIKEKRWIISNIDVSKIFVLLMKKKNSYFGVEKDFVQICREKNIYIVEF